jgi:hypothetical protein
MFATKSAKKSLFSENGPEGQFRIVQKNIHQMCKNSLSHFVICLLQNLKIFTNKKVI